MNTPFSGHLPECLEGAIDLHVHSAPDRVSRLYDDFTLAREAASAGMGGVLLKNHWGSTVERAILTAKAVPGIQVFGGLVLNDTVGGLNPAAVRLALELGARQVWMPTKSAANQRRHHGEPGGIQITDSNGQLLPQTEEILRLIAATDCVLGTGHLGPGEVAPLVRRAGELGIRAILITHPEWGPTFHSNAMQKELLACGNVFFERCFVSMSHHCGCVPLDTISNAIADLGVESTVLSSDLGQPDSPPPVEGMAQYAEQLRALGFSAGDLRRMFQSNPLSVVGEPG